MQNDNKYHFNSLLGNQLKSGINMCDKESVCLSFNQRHLHDSGLMGLCDTDMSVSIITCNDYDDK